MANSVTIHYIQMIIKPVILFLSLTISLLLVGCSGDVLRVTPTSTIPPTFGDANSKSEEVVSIATAVPTPTSSRTSNSTVPDEIGPVVMESELRGSSIDANSPGMVADDSLGRGVEARLDADVSQDKESRLPSGNLSDLAILCTLDELSKVVSCSMSQDIDGKRTWWSNASGQWSESRDFSVTIEREMASVEIYLELCVTGSCTTLTKIVELPPSHRGQNDLDIRPNVPSQEDTRMGRGDQTQEALPPAIIKSLGYDLSSGVKPILVVDYGTLAHTDNRVAYNLQPTFVLPAGTKVTAIIDGIVCLIPELYSGDYSVMMAPSIEQCRVPKYMWEMEHVINVTVEVGDSVTAGQTIAEVSDYSYTYGDPDGRQPRPDRTYGFDLVEIGLLEGGQSPLHHCPWLYIHPSYRDELLNVMADARRAIELEPDNSTNSEYVRYFFDQHITDWETSTGKAEYNSAQYQAPGCKTKSVMGEDALPVRE